jgi:hypothetical protein
MMEQAAAQPPRPAQQKVSGIDVRFTPGPQVTPMPLNGKDDESGAMVLQHIGGLSKVEHASIEIMSAIIGGLVSSGASAKALHNLDAKREIISLSLNYARELLDECHRQAQATEPADEEPQPEPEEKSPIITG